MHTPPTASQRRTCLSLDLYEVGVNGMIRDTSWNPHPDARTLPVGSYPTARVLWECPENVRICFSFSTSQERRILSYDAETIWSYE